MKKIGIFIFVILLFTQGVCAADINSQLSEEVKDELSDFNNSLPPSVQNFIGTDVLNGDFDALLGDKISEKSFLELISNYLLFGIDSVLKSFASILALLIVLALFNSLTSSENNTLHNVFSVSSTLSISLTVFGVCAALAQTTCEFMQTLCNVSTSFLPLMITIMTLNGNISGAIVTNGSMILFIRIVEEFLLKFLLPIVYMCLAFGCVKALNTSIDISGITKTVKTVFTSVTVFAMSIFMFVLSYKSLLSQSADSLKIKTARFAIGSLVPLVGASVNDSLKTLSSGLSLLKTSCGTIAVIAIAVITLPVIINLFLYKISFSLLSIISGAIGGSGEKSVLEEADSICTFLLTLAVCTSVLFIFGITIFIKTGTEMAL